MKTVYLRYSNHSFGVIGPDGRMHAWNHTEEEATEDLFKTLEYFPGSYIVRIDIDPQSSLYPCVSTLYTPV